MRIFYRILKHYEKQMPDWLFRFVAGKRWLLPDPLVFVDDVQITEMYLRSGDATDVMVEAKQVLLKSATETMYRAFQKRGYTPQLNSIMFRKDYDPVQKRHTLALRWTSYYIPYLRLQDLVKIYNEVENKLKYVQTF